MEDRQLVTRFLQTRSESAFRQLYKSKTPHLYRMALRLTGDTDLSEELIQQTWVTAIRKLAGFEWRSELRTWLTGILINLYRNLRREDEKEVELETVPEPSIPASGFTVIDLEAAIRHLPPGYRQIIILHDVEGYTHKEVAGLLDISEGTSKSQLFHARKAIREFLNDLPSKSAKS